MTPKPSFTYPVPYGKAQKLMAEFKEVYPSDQHGEVFEVGSQSSSQGGSQSKESVLGFEKAQLLNLFDIWYKAPNVSHNFGELKFSLPNDQMNVVIDAFKNANPKDAHKLYGLIPDPSSENTSVIFTKDAGCYRKLQSIHTELKDSMASSRIDSSESSDLQREDSKSSPLTSSDDSSADLSSEDTSSSNMTQQNELKKNLKLVKNESEDSLFSPCEEEDDNTFSPPGTPRSS